MFFKATVSQIKFMLQRKSCVIVFYILLAMVLANYVSNVLMFQGTDIVSMYHPMKLLLLSWNRSIVGGDLLLGFLQLYPLLVICPAVFSVAKEQQTGEHVILKAHIGNMTYHFSKVFAAFIVTFIVFVLPFLIEMGLNCLAFPIHAQGDLSNWSYYDLMYKESVDNYLFSKLYLLSPYLYTVMKIGFFGIFSGLLAAFTVAIIFVWRFRYRIFLFFPVMFLLNGTEIISTFLFERKIKFRLAWYNYFTLFNDEPKNMIYYILFIIILTVLTLVGTYLGGKKDCVQ